MWMLISKTNSKCDSKFKAVLNLVLYLQRHHLFYWRRYRTGKDINNRLSSAKLNWIPAIEMNGRFAINNVATKKIKTVNFVPTYTRITSKWPVILLATNLAETFYLYNSMEDNNNNVSISTATVNPCTVLAKDKNSNCTYRRYRIEKPKPEINMQHQG